MTKAFMFGATLAAVLSAASCTHKNEAPGLTGPSGFSTTPANTPIANFTVSPLPVDLSRTGPEGNGLVTFDASSSCGGALVNGVCQNPIASSVFTFNDGTTVQGPIVVRRFTDVGNFPVSLTVTNSTGAAAFATRSFAVVRSDPPKASFVITPAAPVLPPGGGGVLVFFSDTSTPGPNRRIVQRKWDFLDGNQHPATSATTQHQFSTAGQFPVVLTVTDDLGQESVATQAVTVTAPVVIPGTP
jgi:PKD repeat protein